MKRAERDAWVAALRSGEYKQTKGHLKCDSGYCCLGVLCDLEGVDWVPRMGHPSQFHFLEKTSCYEVPISWYGTISNEKASRYGIIDFVSELIAMNDTGKSFAEIADWIEANVPVTD